MKKVIESTVCDRCGECAVGIVEYRHTGSEFSQSYDVCGKCFTAFTALMSSSPGVEPLPPPPKPTTPPVAPHNMHATMANQSR